MITSINNVDLADPVLNKSSIVNIPSSGSGEYTLKNYFTPVCLYRLTGSSPGKTEVNFTVPSDFEMFKILFCNRPTGTKRHNFEVHFTINLNPEIVLSYLRLSSSAKSNLGSSNGYFTLSIHGTTVAGSDPTWGGNYGFLLEMYKYRAGLWKGSIINFIPYSSVVTGFSASIEF